MKATSATEILKSHLDIQSAEGRAFLDRVEVLMYIYRRKAGGLEHARGISMALSRTSLYSNLVFFGCFMALALGLGLYGQRGRGKADCIA